MTARVHDHHLVVDLRDVDGVRSVSTIRFSASGPDVRLDTRGLRVTSVVLNGTPVHTSAGGSVELTGLRPENVVVVDAEVTALQRHRDPADGRWYVAAGAGHLGAPTWFAHLRGQAQKSPVIVEVYCRSGWTVVGNGRALRITDGHYRIDGGRPLAPHLVAFCAGGFHTRRAGGIAFHARASLAGALDAVAPTVLTRAAAFVAEFERLFGIGHPWPTCDFVFVPDAQAAALEHPGCVQLGEALLSGDAGVRDVILAHELAHMWFGNLVTPRTAGDVWLFEAVAEHFGQAVAHDVTGDRAVAAVDTRRRISAFEAACGPRSTSLADQKAQVDRIGYVKGAAALRDLRLRLGEATFLAGLRTFLASARDGVAGLADLLMQWQAEHRGELDVWQRNWLRHRGIGAVSVVDGTATVSGTLPHPVTVRAFDDEGRFLGTRRIEVGARAVALPAGTAVALPGDEDWAYAVLGAQQWRSSRRLATRLSTTDRRALWVAVRTGVAAGRVSGAQALEVVTQLLVCEPDPDLLEQGAAWTVETLLWRCTPTGDETIAAALAQAYAAAEPESARADTAARYWIDVADARPLRQLVARLSGVSRWRAMTRLAALGALEESEIDDAIRGVDDPATLVHAARCRAALPDSASKERTTPQSAFLAMNKHVTNARHGMSTSVSPAASNAAR